MNNLNKLHRELCSLANDTDNDAYAHAAELAAELMASVKDARDAARRVALQQRKLPSLAKRIHVQAAVYDRIIGEEKPNV